ncbi:YggL family protein [Methylotenera sp.]|uniref:YggL 50S ribosome-binding family protein n=1 Tax=Methylotenera sp. TaxID=2051956 RepID=UPI002734C7F9|nr:YggL family protein [Methylotenera sp.]MDP3306981.1 YggL family protein [Methylotenera sp.]
MSKNRSKRLRKKLHIGEFQELGFHLSFSLKDELDAESLEAFIDEFILHAIENNGLVFGGGFNEELNGFVALEKKGSVTDFHLAKIKVWLDSQPSVINIKFGELVDSWV